MGSSSWNSREVRFREKGAADSAWPAPRGLVAPLPPLAVRPRWWSSRGWPSGRSLDQVGSSTSDCRRASDYRAAIVNWAGAPAAQPGQYSQRPLVAKQQEAYPLLTRISQQAHPAMEITTALNPKQMQSQIIATMMSRFEANWKPARNQLFFFCFASYKWPICDPEPNDRKPPVVELAGRRNQYYPIKFQLPIQSISG